MAVLREVELRCVPEPPHESCVEVALFLEALCSEAFGIASDLAQNDRFFPGTVFERSRSGPLVKGEVYRAREASSDAWGHYVIVSVEDGEHFSGQLISPHGPLDRMRYMHRFHEVSGGCVSHELVHFRAAALRGLTAIFVRRTLVEAYLKLRELMAKDSNP